MTGGLHRRELLAGAALASAVSLGGCTGLGPLGGNGRYDPPFPAPATVGGTDAFDFWEYFQPKALAARRDDIGGDYVYAKTSPVPGNFLELTGLRFEELTDYVNAWGVGVLEGSFDRTVVEYELHESALERRGSADGYDRWADPDGTEAVAVGDGGLVAADTRHVRGVEQLELVDAVVDARRNEVERYADANDHLATLLDHLGTGEYVNGSLHGPDGVTDVEERSIEGKVGSGDRRRIEGDEVAFRTVFVFESPAAVDTDATERLVTTTVEEFDSGEPAETVTVEREGRTAVASWTGPLDEFF